MLSLFSGVNWQKGYIMYAHTEPIEPMHYLNYDQVFDPRVLKAEQEKKGNR